MDGMPMTKDLASTCEDAALRALSVPPGEALFDLDGTLIEGDIGEAVLELVLAETGMAWDWPAYHALVATDDMEARTRGSVIQAELAAKALAGLTVASIERFVDEAFARDMVRPQAPVCALAHRLAQHHRVWILTGSADVIGRAVAPRLGLERVIGLRLHIVDTHAGPTLTDTIVPPVTMASSKINAAWVATGRRPAFAIGDSPWDKPLLLHAQSRLGIARIAGLI